MKDKTLFFLVLMFACTTVFAYDWSSNPGNGTTEDPYQISTPEQLMSIGSNEVLLTKHYILTSDIVFDPNNNSEHVFDQALIAPASTGYPLPDAHSFKGIFNGNGFSVCNLRWEILDLQDRFIGLFGYLGFEGTLKNMILHNCTIDNNSYRGLTGSLVGYASGIISNCSSDGTVSSETTTGGLIGYLYASTVTDCHFSGTVEQKLLAPTGGLIGANKYGVIRNSSAHGQFRKTNPASLTFFTYLGGLIGQSQGQLYNCHTTGSVIGQSRYCISGGLIGRQHGLVQDCYSTCSVHSDGAAGGLIAFADPASINNCYALGNVTSDDYPAGGLAATNSGTVTNCFAAGIVSGRPEDSGGLIAHALEGFDNTITNCYWNAEIQTHGINSSFGSVREGVVIENVQSYTTEQMKQRASFVGWDFVGEDTNGNNETWRMCVDDVDYPRLSWEFAQNGDFACGDGVDIFDLQALAEHWLLTEITNPTVFSYACDANGDGTIDMRDFSVLGKNW
jgi:hypothetical protein